MKKILTMIAVAELAAITLSGCMIESGRGVSTEVLLTLRNATDYDIEDFSLHLWGADESSESIRWNIPLAATLP